MAQQLVVAVIVLLAALYSTWALMPAGGRRRLATLVARQAGRLGATAQSAQRLETALASSAGCSECSSCKGCASPSAPGAPQVIAMPEKFSGRRQA